MKNQYFGDINDYRKYGLLRLLTGRGSLSTAICWMLTPNDRSPDGKFTQYLQQPENYRRFDPDLFDTLRQLVSEQKRRDVQAIEESESLPNCRFLRAELANDGDERRSYFQKFFKLANGVDLVFFDPDNGLEVKSRPLGSKNSSKYLYCSEVQKTFEAGHSVLIYQHFRRQERDPFIEHISDKIGKRLGASEVHSCRTSNVVFFLTPQEHHSHFFAERCREIEDAWRGEIWLG